MTVDIDVWQQRQVWIDEELEQAEKGGHIISEYVLALFMDMSLAYCAGAWVSVIVMSVTIMDAHFREETMDNNTRTAKLLRDNYEGENIDWLRELRNKYVHHNIDNPVIDTEDCFCLQSKKTEREATTAIRMVIKALFQNPFI
ncbi:MAG: hypothetical protein LBV41_04270 [Cytophagaceae bacterium]|jgi:hypothetical protein|nr:hypothetical protein [Cytophagaceae bacterium]